MNITRRDALRQCLVISVGTAIIPSCIHAKTKPAIVLKNLKLDGDQEKLISEVCETIIPVTQTPGAKDTLTDLFVLKMLDDIYSKEEQQKFVEGLKAFDNIAQTRLDKSFIKAGPPQREQLLLDIFNNNSKDTPENVASFLKTMKKLTVQGYLSSRHYLTKVRVYELVPGRFRGCFPVTSLNTKELQINRKEIPI